MDSDKKVTAAAAAVGYPNGRSPVKPMINTSPLHIRPLNV